MPLASDWVLWIVIVASGLLTYGLRSSFVFLFGWLGELPTRLERTLAYVPVAVLSALVVPALLVQDGHLLLGPGNERLLAGAAATVAAWVTENMFITIAVGIACFWGLRILV